MQRFECRLAIQLVNDYDLSLSDKRPSSTSTTTTRGTTSTTTTTTRKTTTAPTSAHPVQNWPIIDRPSSSRAPQVSLIPVSSTPPPQPSYINTRRTNIYSSSYSTSTTTTTTTTTRKPTVKSRTTRPTIYRTQDNEINDSLLRPNKAASARLNMGGIIALAVFGGFVFLAAVITIVVIIVRR